MSGADLHLGVSLFRTWFQPIFLLSSIFVSWGSSGAFSLANSILWHFPSAWSWDIAVRAFWKEWEWKVGQGTGRTSGWGGRTWSPSCWVSFPGLLHFPAGPGRSVIWLMAFALAFDIGGNDLRDPPFPYWPGDKVLFPGCGLSFVMLSLYCYYPKHPSVEWDTSRK